MTNLILGGCGQDAFFMGELLYDKNQEFSITTKRFESPYYYEKFRKNMVRVDLTKSHEVDILIEKIRPEKIYNFAGVSNITESFENPSFTIGVNTQINTNILESVKRFCPESKVYFASSIEHFLGHSPYGLSKTLCMNINQYYRDRHNIFIASGINCQHNSKYRGESFFWGKVCSYIAKLKHFLSLINYEKIEFNTTTIQCGKEVFPKLKLGNLDVARDILSAQDVVNSAFLMLDRGEPKDYIVTSGNLYSNKLILEMAFKYFGINNWADFCYQDKSLFRPKDDNGQIFYSNVLEKDTGWKQSITVEELLKESIDYAIRRVHSSCNKQACR